MHLVPAPAVRLMKRRVLSRPGVNRVSRCDDSTNSKGSIGVMIVLIPSLKGDACHG